VLERSEVRLRFNNWDRVRAAQLPGLLIPAAVCGALALMFLLVVTGRLAYRGEQAARY
jgi:predicted xylose isomerase-like sugar epimerase